MIRRFKKAHAAYAKYRKQLFAAPALVEKHFIEAIKEVKNIEKKKPRNTRNTQNKKS
jgi:hypothetical protein